MSTDKKSFIHPYYHAFSDRWETCIDSYDGEDAIKEATIRYLPATSGHRLDGFPTEGTTGYFAYQAYLLRAVYPAIYKTAVEGAIGIMHREPAKIELPKQLEPMRENCSLLGESLQMFLRRINARQLITGRLGLLADLKKDGDKARPVIAVYNETSILNWNDVAMHDEDVDLKFVLLDESSYEMDDDFSWSHVEKFRALLLSDEAGNIVDNGIYASATVSEVSQLVAAVKTAPNYMGKRLDKIPFVFINSKDLSPKPDAPPFSELANLCLAIYRGEADYRQSLFMQGQETLVRVGFNDTDDDDGDAVRTGAGSRIDVPIGGDAKYIGVSASGLGEQRQALENDYNRAIQLSGQLLDATSRAKESGDALRIRVAAQTATLPQIAMAGAAGLEKILKIVAEWLGANPDEVKVSPNLNFTEADLNGQTLVNIMQAKTLDAPLSEESIHEWMQEQGFTKITYDEEKQRLANEEPKPGTGKDFPSPVDQ